MNAKIIELPAVPKHPTIEDVKQLEHFKHYTDEEAKELLQTIKTLCQVTLSLSLKKQRKQKSKLVNPVKVTPVRRFKLTPCFQV